MPGIALVMTTAGSAAEASRIARGLVEAALAACVNVVPGISSTYRWQGEVKSETEWLLIIKTRTDRFEEVRAAIRKLHSYELPEVLMIEAGAVDPAFAAWIDASLKGEG